MTGKYRILNPDGYLDLVNDYIEGNLEEVVRDYEGEIIAILANKGYKVYKP